MLMSVAQAAKLKKVTRFSVHRWLGYGLKFAWIDGKRMIDSRDLEKFAPRKVGNPNLASKK